MDRLIFVLSLILFIGLSQSTQAACNANKLLSDMNNCLKYKRAFEIKDCILEGLQQEAPHSSQGNCVPANVKGCSCKSGQGKTCNIEEFSININKCLVPRDSDTIKHCIFVAFSQGAKYTHEGNCFPSNVKECSCKEE